MPLFGALILLLANLLCVAIWVKNPKCTANLTVPCKPHQAIEDTISQFTCEEVFGCCWKEESNTCWQPPGSPKGTPCGVIIRPQILAGHTASFWPASVQLEMNTRNGHSSHCEGTLITENIVLTAAHCFLALDEMASLTVLISQTKKGVAKESLNVALNDIRQNAGFVKYTSNWFDIALVRLPKIYPSIPVPCLPSFEFQLPLKSKCIAVGFGVTGAAGKFPEKLQQIELSTKNMSECGGPVLGICAEDPKKKGSTCRGDSGGPLYCMQISEYNIARYFVHGVLSGGQRICESLGEYVSYFTPTSIFRHWIDMTVNYFNRSR